MTSATILTLPIIGTDIFKCGDPKTEENSYYYKGRPFCRKCRKERSYAQFQRSKTNELPPSKRKTAAAREFCPRCEAGDCKNGRIHPGGCFRDVSTWSINWKREMRSRFNNVETEVSA